MSGDMQLKCDTGDGATLTVVPPEPSDGRVWIEIIGGEIEGMCRLSRADARALGQRLIELAGGEAPAVAWTSNEGTWIEAHPLHVEFLRAEASRADGTSPSAAQDGSSVAQADGGAVDARPGHAPGCHVTSAYSWCTFDCPSRRARVPVEAQSAGVDLASGPSTVAAAVLERQPDGEFKPLATFEGPDAERQAQAFAESLPFSVDPVVRLQAPADDGRWMPGAVWECGGHRFAVERVDAEQMVRFLDGWSVRQDVLTPENGWRFIGRLAEEPGQ